MLELRVRFNKINITVMNYIILLSLALALSACSSLKVLTTRYNSVEQDHYASIAAYSKIGVELCHNPKDILSLLTIIRIEANTVLIYTQHQDTADEDAAAILVDMIDEMHKRYARKQSPSEQYCKQKLTNIEEASTIIMKAVGNLE